jgi:hypothetical protein
MVDEVVGEGLFALDDGCDERFGSGAVSDGGEAAEGEVAGAGEVVHGRRWKRVVWQLGGIAALLEGEAGECVDERLVAVVSAEGAVEVTFGAFGEGVD